MPEPPSTPPVAVLIAELRESLVGGRPARVEDEIARYPTLRDEPDAVLDLIREEVTLRQERGETPEPDEYRARFPWLSDRLDTLFEVPSTLAPDAVPSTV